MGNPGGAGKRGLRPPIAIRKTGLAAPSQAHRHAAGDREERRCASCRVPRRPRSRRDRSRGCRGRRGAARRGSCSPRPRPVSSGGNLTCSLPMIASRSGDGSSTIRPISIEQHARAPSELHHRREDEAIGRRREDGLQVADDLLRVRDRIRREHDRVERAVLDAVPQRIDLHRPVEAGQPADAIQGEAVAELDRRELHGDDDEEREAGRPSGIVVVIRPMALIEIPPLTSSCSTPPYCPRSTSKKRNPPPTTALASIRNPTPRGGLKPKVEIGRPEIAAAVRKRQARAHADLIHAGQHGAQLEARRRRGYQLDKRAGRLTLRHQGQIDRVDLQHAEEIEMHRQRRLDRRAAAEDEAALARPSQVEVELDLQRLLGHGVA